MVTSSMGAHGPVVEQRGLWFEEFVVGTTICHRPGRHE